jgi:myosin heavy subunit
LRHYLLEKSRVVVQPSGEGNYHAFGYLVAGLDAALKDKLHLTSVLQDNRYAAPVLRLAV